MNKFKVGDIVVVVVDGWSQSGLSGIVKYTPDNGRSFNHVDFGDTIGRHAFTDDEIDFDKPHIINQILSEL